MYELIQVSEHSYYIQSPAKIGLVKLNEQDVCLIDCFFTHHPVLEPSFLYGGYL